MNRKQKLAMIFAILFAFIAITEPFTLAATSLKFGSRGSKVSELQTLLKRWGYYSGPIDGIFGSLTQSAVIAFQKRNGLTADGVVGTQTANAIGIKLDGDSSSGSSSGSTSSSGSSGDVYLLARIIHGEARGEPYKGQVAVGAVVLNRVESSKFPNTLSGVIYQGGAFDAVSDGQINMAPDNASIKAARDALNGYDPTNGCLYYYNPATATSRWMLSKPVLLRIGEHAFCK